MSLRLFEPEDPLTATPQLMTSAVTRAIYVVFIALGIVGGFAGAMALTALSFVCESNFSLTI